MPKPPKPLFEYEDENRYYAREWRASVNENIDDLYSKMAKLENVIASKLGWFAGVQFVCVGVIGFLAFILKH